MAVRNAPMGQQGPWRRTLLNVDVNNAGFEMFNKMPLQMFYRKGNAFNMFIRHEDRHSAFWLFTRQLFKLADAAAGSDKQALKWRFALFSLHLSNLTIVAVPSDEDPINANFYHWFNCQGVYWIFTIQCSQTQWATSAVYSSLPKLGSFEGFCFVNLTVDAYWYMETLCDRLSEQENADFSVNTNGAAVVTVLMDCTSTDWTSV